MSAFNKWAKGQSADDLDEDELDEELDGDEDGDDEEELDGPDPEAIAARLWSGELGEEAVATMDGELLGQVIDASAEVEPEMHAGVVGLAEAVAAEDLAAFRDGYKALMEAELHGEGGPFDAEQCLSLLDETFEKVSKGTKLDTPDGKKLLAKLISMVRSSDGAEEEEEPDELDGEMEDDTAADDAALAEFDA